jgi:hypothetical protein
MLCKKKKKKNLNFANNWSDFETNKPAINANFGYNNRELE